MKPILLGIFGVAISLFLVFGMHSFHNFLIEKNIISKTTLNFSYGKNILTSEELA